ncbi:SDR family oxidoreductase [Sphingomonas sp. YL-JM2C]
MGNPSPAAIAIVTGGEGGIGAAIVSRLAALGLRVVSADIATAPGATGDDAVIRRRLDLTDAASIDAFVEEAGALGTIVALVNCAGIIAECTAEEVPGPGVRRMLDVNLLGAAHMTAAIAPLMTRGGAIVNISSISSRLPELANAVLYGASKSALETYTRASARALAPKGIRVNSLAPGFIDVAMTDAMRTIAYGEGSPLRRVAAGRMGTADEIAACVEFLLSDQASYVVGATLVVDGGLALN